MYFVKKVTLVTVFIFTGLSAVFAQMTTKDGKPLKYYAPGPYARTSAGLIQTGNGNCEAWTYFFLDTLKVHGISTKGAVIKIGYPPTNGVYAILMKEWIFEGEGKSGNSEYPYVNVFALNSTPQDIPTMTKLVYCEVRPGETVKGQGATTPLNTFSNHMFVNINGKYYDPSYGTESDDDRDFMLSGYMWIAKIQPLSEANFDIDFNGNGTKTDIVQMPCVFYKKHQKNWVRHEVLDY